MRLKFLAILAFFVSAAMAREDRYFSRSVRGMLMGDAYTAIADDEYTLFYNPAILGRHEGFSFWPINPVITVTNPLSDEFSNIDAPGGTPSELASAFMNKPVHIGLGATPGFKLGRFGLSAIVGNQTHFNIVNEVTPMLDVDHRYDRGFTMGYAIPVPLGAGGLVSFGFAAKWVERESLYGEYNLTSPTTVDAIGAGEMDAVLNALGKTKGDGWGYDLGVDYVKKSSVGEFTMGLALLDIFTNLSTDDGTEVQPQPMKLNYGAGYKADLGMGLDFTLSLDIRNLEQQMEFMRRVRLGGEVGLTPALSLLGGINANQYSYGLKLNSGLLKIFLGMYGVDIGESLGEQVSKRVALYLSLFDFKFDG